MPIYEFKCKDCSLEFEEICSLSGDQKIVCPDCKSENVERMLSAFTSSLGTSSGMGGFASPPPSSGGCGSGGFS